MFLDDFVNFLSEEVREFIFFLLMYVVVVVIMFLVVVCVCFVKFNSKEDESEWFIFIDFVKVILLLWCKFVVGWFFGEFEDSSWIIFVWCEVMVLNCLIFEIFGWRGFVKVEVCIFIGEVIKIFLVNNFGVLFVICVDCKSGFVGVMLEVILEDDIFLVRDKDEFCMFGFWILVELKVDFFLLLLFIFVFFDVIIDVCINIFCEECFNDVKVEIFIDVDFFVVIWDWLRVSFWFECFIFVRFFRLNVIVVSNRFKDIIVEIVVEVVLVGLVIIVFLLLCEKLEVKGSFWLGDMFDKIGIFSSLGVIIGILLCFCFIFERFFGLVFLFMDEVLIIIGFFEEISEIVDEVGEIKDDDKFELVWVRCVLKGFVLFEVCVWICLFLKISEILIWLIIGFRRLVGVFMSEKEFGEGLFFFGCDKILVGVGEFSFSEIFLIVFFVVGFIWFDEIMFVLFCLLFWMVGFEESVVVEWILVLMGIVVWGFILVCWLFLVKGKINDEYGILGLFFWRFEKLGLFICDCDDFFFFFVVDFFVEL